MRRRAFPLAALFLAFACSGPPPPSLPETNLLLLTVSPLRADRLGIYGNPRNLTPNLDLLAADGAIFLGARTPWPEIGRAAAATLTGLDPARASAVPNGEGPALLVAPETLAGHLRGFGYQTFAATDHPALTRATGFGRGFDGFEEHWPLSPVEGAAAVASSFADGAIAPPFFAWLHLSTDGIAEERAKAAVREMPTGLGPPGFEEETDRFDAEVHAVDRLIGDLLASFRTDGSGRTVFVVAGLTGDSLGERGEARETPRSLFDEALRVPLLVRVLGGSGEDFPQGSRFSELVTLADIPATALDLMGRTGDAGPATGRVGTSLLPALRGEEFRPHRRLHATSDRGASAILDGRLKLLRIPLPGSPDPRGSVFALYALDQDPGETDNRYFLASRSVEPLRAELETRRIQTVAWSRESDRVVPQEALPEDLVRMWEARR